MTDLVWALVVAFVVITGIYVATPENVTRGWRNGTTMSRRKNHCSKARCVHDVPMTRLCLKCKKENEKLDPYRPWLGNDSQSSR